MTPASLNPGTLRDWLDAQGYLSHSSDRSQDRFALSFGLITRYSSPGSTSSTRPSSPRPRPSATWCPGINNLISSGYYVIARVNYSGHFVPIARVVGEDARSTPAPPPKSSCQV